ncbi:uncharacterized protein LOC120167655 isoform X1 [Hibiscus syriacus]|uniref:uncharacterized protein LOC120167655 isoform X1 n=1 Tax=Hibiscus syriacus TaxID=106335 RepID=UPI001921A61C|nr:uncharacterized protein LOC120167655 isoform X1 [Hibiscus syriacus]
MTKDATSKVPALIVLSLYHLIWMPGQLSVECASNTANRARLWQVDSPKIPSFQPGTSANDKMKNLQGKATTAEYSVQCQELNQQIMNPILGNGKRKPLPWTTEEVDILKEGVRRFSLTANKTSPGGKLWNSVIMFSTASYSG